jgi:hypothetical protein
VFDAVRERLPMITLVMLTMALFTVLHGAQMYPYTLVLFGMYQRKDRTKTLVI